MNSKKITALALAALMAVGSTGTVFAVPANGNALDFYDEGVESTRLYKEVDGVLVPSTNFAPGNAIYIRLDEQTDVESKDAKKMNLYATWKVGEDYVEDLDIVYKKGAIGATTVTYTVTVGGKTLSVAGETKQDVIDAINAEIAKNPAFLADEIAAAKADAKKTDGWKDSTKWYAVEDYTEYAANGSFKNLADDKYYANTDAVVAKYVTDTFAVGGDTVTGVWVKAADVSADFGKANVDAADATYTEDKSANKADYLLDGNSGEVNFVKKAATITAANLQTMGLIAVEAGAVVVDADTQLKADGVTKVDGVVYADADGNLVAEEALKTAAIDAIAAAAVKDIKTTVDTESDYAYFAKIVTKSSTTTKTIDLAGDLFIGRNKSSADGFDESAHFALDVTLSNRGTGAVGSPDYDIKVDGDIQIDPDKKAVLQFADEAEEVVIEFGDGIGYFEFNAKGQKALNFAYTLDFNEEIADMFPDANLDFITWKAAPATNKTGTLYLYADEDTFIYELPSSSNAATAVLKEVKNAKYNEDEGAWEIRTRKLVGYVISDKELDVETVTVDSSASTGSSTGNNNSGKPNPDTGR